MKKLLSIFLALVAVLSLVACDNDQPDEPVERTYAADGQYTAYIAHDNHGAPQLTWVTVTIENDAIVSYYIDQLQGAATAWNEQTKKELGFGYRMHGQTDLSETEYEEYLDANGLLEWHEQAALIEQHFLTTLDVTIKEDGTFDGIANVTISDNQYLALAKQAVEYAKAGTVVVFDANIYQSKVNLTSAQAKVNAEGKITEVKIDELQSQIVEEVWSWKAQTKQQLGNDYGMAGKNDKNDDGLTLEWFEQANAIAAAWLNGDDVSDITTVTGVSISDSGYTAVLNKLTEAGWTR